MRISMWMLANQLYNFEPELYIQSNAPISLKSARRAYATNCVHVYQQGKDVICDGEGDRIILRDMDVEIAFEIVQSIFDYYDDWKTSVINVAAQHDYEMLLNVTQQIFHNPLLIISPSYKVIAMSNYTISEEDDDEWNYLQKYGFTSYDTAQMMFDMPTQRKQSLANTPQIMKFPKSAHKSNCLTTSIFYDNNNCGRHNKGINVKESELERWLKYKRWTKNDTYHLIALSQDYSEPNTGLPLLNNLIEQNIPGSETYIVNNKLVVLINASQMDYDAACDFMSTLTKNNSACMGLSLPFNELTKVADFFSQAVSAIEYGSMFSEDKSIFDFYDYAIYYMMEQSDISLLLSAIHPDVRAIWCETGDEHSRDKINTISSYIKNERSLVKTAKELYVHRNTLIYRLKKTISEMKYDIEDSYTRTYFIYSIDVLNLYLTKYVNSPAGVKADKNQLYLYKNDI